MNAAPTRTGESFSPGDVVASKYRLTALIGSGGMAEVWEATNIDLDAPVAIKCARADILDPTARERLLREARTAAQLSHPAVVRVFDSGVASNGSPYVVMERLRGRTLGDVLRTKQRPRAVEAIQVVLPILDALDYAHNRGLVHRDIKPDNIFIAKVGSGKVQPKLLDFGVARLDQRDVRLTQTGMTLGSPAYMSPQQAGGERDIDGRADIWSISVVLFEAICGRLPFEAENYNAMMRCILVDPVPHVMDVVSEDLDENMALVRMLDPIIAKGLEKSPDARWQTAGDLAVALADCLLQFDIDEDATGNRITHYHSEPITQRPPTPPPDQPQWRTPENLAQHLHQKSPAKPSAARQPWRLPLGVAVGVAAPLLWFALAGRPTGDDSLSAEPQRDQAAGAAASNEVPVAVGSAPAAAVPSSPHALPASPGPAAEMTASAPGEVNSEPSGDEQAQKATNTNGPAANGPGKVVQTVTQRAERSKPAPRAVSAPPKPRSAPPASSAPPTKRSPSPKSASKPKPPDTSLDDLDLKSPY